MYSIDLTKFTIEEFHQMLLSIDLLPGRRILLNNLGAVIEKLKARKINTLGAVQKLLKKKADYPQLSRGLSVDEEYLVILNREINSYESKPMPLEKLEIFAAVEITALAGLGVTHTKGLYESCCKKMDRKKLAAQAKIAEALMINALQLVDLLRVNGIGPIYAKILIAAGVHNKDMYLAMPSDTILSMVQQVNQAKGLTNVRLGIKDVEYCKRFCQRLDSDIEW